MIQELTLEPMDKVRFAPFGDVLDCVGPPDKMINKDTCGRFHDRALMDFSNGRAGISMFEAQSIQFPYQFNMMERHPDGVQAFIPMTYAPFMVVVAPDENGVPGQPIAFRTEPGQAINYHRNVWHGVLTPLSAPALFAVVDRIGEGPNIEQHNFDTSFTVVDA
ncbi:MAG: ureidoglycolate lyase [Rhodobacteraceae bacterium]|nr:ureidoglycolate lyase [Paracoccaceae bacterium]